MKREYIGRVCSWVINDVLTYDSVNRVDERTSQNDAAVITPPRDCSIVTHEGRHWQSEMKSKGSIPVGTDEETEKQSSAFLKTPKALGFHTTLIDDAETIASPKPGREEH